MIIWTGFGFLGVIIPLITWGIGFAITNPSLIGGAIGLLIGAVGVWFFGNWINVQRPAQKLEELVAARSRELHAAADNNTFHLGPGHQAPRTREEAHAQAEMLLAAQRDQAAKNLRNRHTLFWIPVQFVAFLLLVPAVGMFIASFNGS